METVRKARSFSEGHIDIIRGPPRVLSNLQILLEDAGTPTLSTPPEISTPPDLLSSPVDREEPLLSFLHRWSLRFSVHLSLIALFETLFFWLFVSRTEDSALISLVNSYIKGLLGQCSAMNRTQQVLFMDFMNIFVNQTQVQAQGVVAAAGRSAFNGVN